MLFVGFVLQVSSRDSAYNGGISSGGESREPTPDQTGNRKHSKKSERKGKRKMDQKRHQSADSKTRRKLENKLKKKLLLSECHEIQEQRLPVGPWQGMSQDDHGDEVVKNIHNLHIDSHGEDSSMENGSPLNTVSHIDDGSLTDQSIEEDMEEEPDEQEEVELGKEDAEEDSLVKDDSPISDESFKNQQPLKSLCQVNKLQVGTQTDIQGVKLVTRTLSSSNKLQHSTSQSHSVSSHLL